MTTPDRWATEHIDANGHLRVPVGRSSARAPERAGWTPTFVAVNLDRDPQKVVTYAREDVIL